MNHHLFTLFSQSTPIYHEDVVETPFSTLHCSHHTSPLTPPQQLNHHETQNAGIENWWVFRQSKPIFLVDLAPKASTVAVTGRVRMSSRATAISRERLVEGAVGFTQSAVGYGMEMDQTVQVRIPAAVVVEVEGSMANGLWMGVGGLDGVTEERRGQDGSENAENGNADGNSNSSGQDQPTASNSSHRSPLTPSPPSLPLYTPPSGPSTATTLGANSLTHISLSPPSPTAPRVRLPSTTTTTTVTATASFPLTSVRRIIRSRNPLHAPLPANNEMINWGDAMQLLRALQDIHAVNQRGDGVLSPFEAVAVRFVEECGGVHVVREWLGRVGVDLRLERGAFGG